MTENFYEEGSFLCRNGAAKSRSKDYANKKLCFVATDQNFLMELLFELSNLEDCFFVKLSSRSRDGMYLGRCFFTTDKLVGDYWAKYKMHPKLMCCIQDDDFTSEFREKVQNYKVNHEN